MPTWICPTWKRQQNVHHPKTTNCSMTMKHDLRGKMQLVVLFKSVPHKCNTIHPFRQIQVVDRQNQRRIVSFDNTRSGLQHRVALCPAAQLAHCMSHYEIKEDTSCTPAHVYILEIFEMARVKIVWCRRQRKRGCESTRKRSSKQ